MRKYSVILFIFVASTAFAQNSKVFENRDLGMAFNATENWKQLNVSTDQFMKLVNCNNNLEVRMWVDDKASVRKTGKYLQKLAHSEGLLSVEAPFETTVDQQKAMAILAECNEMHKPIRILLVAFIKNDKLHLVRFKCPDECYREHKGKMEKLISSVHLLPQEESFHFLASKKTTS